MTYLDERAKPYVEPLAKDLQAPIFMRFNVDLEGQTEKVFERIEKEWGELDILLHSIAFSPKEALHGRVIDVGRDGFLKTMDVSCWSFIRMAHLAEPLMKNGGTMFTMTYYGSQAVIEHYNVMLRKRRWKLPSAISPPRSAPEVSEFTRSRRDRSRPGQRQAFRNSMNCLTGRRGRLQRAS